MPFKTRYLQAYSLLGPLGTLITAFLSDHYESRGVTVATVSMISVAGFALYLGNVFLIQGSFLGVTCYLGAEHQFTLYGALYLIVPGMHAIAPVLAAWLANNSETYYRRATTIALTSMIANAVCSTVKYTAFPIYFLPFRAAF